MKTIYHQWENEVLGKFSSDQGVSFRIILVNSFWHLSLVLGVLGFGIRRSTKI